MSYFKKSPLDTFCNSITLGVPNNCFVPSNTINSVKLIEIRLAKFRTTINLKVLDLPHNLVLDEDSKLLDYGINLIFESQGVNLDFTRKLSTTVNMYRLHPSERTFKRSNKLECVISQIL